MSGMQIHMETEQAAQAVLAGPRAILMYIFGEMSCGNKNLPVP
jgi:hypothetical protein